MNDARRSGALAAPYSRRNTLEELARETGGIAIVGTADPQAAADRIVREIGTY